MKRRIWSEAENEALVADYLDMLKAEQRGVAFNKAAHVRALIPRLDRRTKAAIEDKHENVSAIAHELDFPSIEGYKPQGNYQKSLYRVVARQFFADQDLASILESALTAEAALPMLDHLSESQVDPPTPIQGKLRPDTTLPELRIPRPNWLAIEAANRSLGRAGEEWVVAYEQDRLSRAGRWDLAGRVEHVAATVGDGLGFDVHSYETQGAERFIEVKTTANAKETPFFITRNELRVSKLQEDAYRLYRLFRFRNKPQFFSLSGSLEKSCVLDPVQYAARVK